ncbi:odorant receptor 7a-like [Schistocerca piceifrons]|uniref:odorant receptor 7a-like n=1 Tax=Schistocerca piceifrons TaxID=274613 RepID=UPI001F5EFCF6|nr:odorant receptor 7a-like [Schistocerca piceifrons]
MERRNTRDKATEGDVLTWGDTADSVLKYNIRQLNVWGVWPLPGSALFHAYTVFIFAMGLGGLAQDLAGVYVSWSDLQEVTMALIHILSVCGGFVKLAFFIRRRPMFNVLVRRTDQMVSAQKEFCASDESLRAMLKASHRKAVYITLFAYGYLFLQGGIWLPMPLIAYPGQRKLPFVQVPGADTTSVYLYALLYSLQCLSSMFITFVGVTIDCFFAVVMIHTVVQFRILNARIKALRPDVAASASCRIVVGRQTNFHDNMYNQLCQCIQTHQRLLRFVSFLDSVMNPIVMTQFTFGVMVAGVTLFQATYGEAVCGALYSCGWMEAPACFRRAMRIVMCCAQRPLSLTAGRVYAINRATFISRVGHDAAPDDMSAHVSPQGVVQCCLPL